MLRQSDLKILSSLRQKPLDSSAVSEETGLARETVQRRITELRDQELVEILEDVEATNRLYRRQQSGIATALDRAADSVPHVELTAFLTPSILKVLYWLNYSLGPSEIASRIDLSRVRVQQLLSTLVRRQFVTKQQRGEYEIKSEYGQVIELAEEVAYHTQLVDVRKALPDSTIIWAAPCQALVVPGESTIHIIDELVTDSEWALTGLAAYQEFGFDFATAGAPLLYRTMIAREGGAELTVTEVVSHALCRRVEHRLVRFSALVVLDALANGTSTIAEFVDTASIYGVQHEIDALLTFLRSRGDEDALPTDLVPLFPSWKRFVDTGAQYGLDIEHTIGETTLDTWN